MIAIVAVGAGGAFAVVLATRQPTKPASTFVSGPSKPQAQAPLTVPEAILQQHTESNGTLDLEGALEMFSYVFTPIPGVTLPSGAADDRAQWADLAAELIAANIDELTAAQRQAVMPIFSGVAASAPTNATAARSTTLRTGPVLTDAQLLFLPAPFVGADIGALVTKAFAAEGQLLGHTIASAPVNTDLSHIHVFLAAANDVTDTGSVGLAWTVGTHGPGFDAQGQELELSTDAGKVTDCYIFIGPTIWNSKDVSGHWVPSDLDVAAIYHEVFHCYQDFVIGSLSGEVADSAPAWIMEGGATWAAASILPYDDEHWWIKYIDYPGQPLANRSYSAFGLFFEIGYLGRPLWPQWWNIWSAAAAGGWGITDWFDAAAGDRLTALDNDWAASFYRDPTLGHDWTVTGVGQLLHPPAPATPATFGGQLTVKSPPYATAQVLIPPQKSGTIVVSASQAATFRILDATGRQEIGVSYLAMCWGTCGTCPGASKAPPTFRVTGLVHWASATQQSFNDTQLAATNLKTYCMKQQSDWTPPYPNTCLAQCAGSNGDPHMRSVNQRIYNFQAAGEYVLLRAAGGSVEIEGRQEPASNPGSDATINTAVAARVGSHRVGVYAPGGAQVLSVHVDGNTVALTSPLSLSGGGHVLPKSNGVEVDFPDGTVLWALYTKERWGINVEIAPSPSVLTSATGVLGRVGLGYALPLLPDGTGTHISANPVAQYNYRYQVFAPAWRVTDATSLFDYDPGKTTESYNVPGFVPEGGPPKTVPFDPQTLATSESTCAPIVDADLRNDCVYDVTATGDPTFVTAYSDTATFFSGIAPSTSPPGAQTSPTPTASGSAIHEVLAGANQSGYVVGPDGSLDILVVAGNQEEVIAVDATTTAIRAQASLGPVRSLSVPRGLVSSSGSLWLVVGTGLETCAVDQLDPSTLAVQNTMPLPGCPAASPGIGGSATEVWTDDGKGHLVRIDMAHKDFSATIAAPANTQQTTPEFLSSDTSLFWTDELGIYRVDAQTSSLIQISDQDRETQPAGDGVWEELDVATVGFFDNNPSTPTTTLSVPRDLIGADANNVYTEDPTTHDILEYPINGSPGAGLGTSYWPIEEGSTLLIGPHNAFRVFAKPPQPGASLAIYVENFPLP